MHTEGSCSTADLLSRLHLLLHATASSPGDTALLQLASAQAIAATGADMAMLGTVRGPKALDVAILSGVGQAVVHGGALPLDTQYPLADAVVTDKSIWLSSPPEIRLAYPTASGLWGCAFAAVPLTAKRVPVGAIGVIHSAAGHYHCEAERVFLSAVADICATIVGASDGMQFSNPPLNKAPDASQR